jgi:hypothetical protein
VETVPQRLKPHSKFSGYGTAEAVPLSKAEYFNKLLSELQPAVVSCGLSLYSRASIRNNPSQRI